VFSLLFVVVGAYYVVTGGGEDGRHSVAQTPFAGFGHRVGARLVDLALFAVVQVPVFYAVNGRSAPTDVVLNFLWGVAIYAYNLAFLATTGQTIGKRVARIRVVSLDGSRPGWARSVLRNASDLVWTLYFCAVQAVMILSIPESQYSALTLAERGRLLRTARPEWAHCVDIAFALWMVLELALFRFTRKKQAAHDFIGGTVVVRA
jgi:uncharacterized RDD family membrane protein YckC